MPSIRMPHFPTFDFGFDKMEDEFSHIGSRISKEMANMEHHMHDVFSNSKKSGDMNTSSYSSSYSSSTDNDGTVHEHKSANGEQTSCENGVCKTVTCSNGKCTEKVSTQ